MDGSVYMSAWKSMTVHMYLHSITKRAKGITLIDSGVTENFMNLQYAKWLQLPIKQLATTRPIFNVDGTKNKGGMLHYYTDLSIQTGQQQTMM
jgi:hypothetical protein